MRYIGSMNIFILDKNTRRCAQYHNDKHVVKMILETAQLLCAVHHNLGSKDVPYKSTHKNHPCAIWARENISNYYWLLDLGFELCREYTYRYSRQHKSELVLNWCLGNTPNLPDEELSAFALAMPDDCKQDCAIQSYRKYYIMHKRDISKWTNREVPKWFY